MFPESSFWLTDDSLPFVLTGLAISLGIFVSGVPLWDTTLLKVTSQIGGALTQVTSIETYY